MVERDGISSLVKALESKRETVRDECAKCLGKIASISHSLRDDVIQGNGLISL